MGGSASSGSSKTPVAAPVSLQANNVAKILEVISEGECEGLVNGLNSVYLDGTPIQNTDGSFNFSGLEFQWRLGTATQEPLTGFGGIEAYTAINTKVEQASPIVRSITNPLADYVRVKVATPALQEQNATTGDVNPSSVWFKIEVQENGTGYKQAGSSWQAVTVSKNGTYTTPATTTGLRIVASKAVANLSEPFIMSNTVDVSFDYTLLPSGSPETEEYTVSPIAYAVNGGSIQAVTSNFKLEQNGVSTAGQYTLHYRLDEQLDGLAGGSYLVAVPSGWTIGAVYALVPATLVLSGRTTSTYEREYFITLPKANGGSPWDVRITRLTADGSSNLIQNDLYFASIVEGVEAKVSYLNTAVAGLKLDASLFGNNIPARSYLLNGVKVRVPSNYDPITRAYDESGGYWDGTFSTAWTDNPAWILLDVLTNARYGGGQFLSDDNVDKFDFYECGKYCDELVPVAGKPAMEPRYTFNYCFNNTDEFYSVVRQIAASFHAMVSVANDVVRLTMDKPKAMVAIFSQANVVSAGGVAFQYSTTAADNTNSVAQVRWNDPANEYKQATVTVESPDLIDVYGFQIETVASVGCVSEGQARRMGEWVLDTYRSNYQAVTFITGLDGADIALGDVVGVFDPHYADLRMSGRVQEWLADIGGSGYEGLKADSSIAYNASDSYTCTLTMPDGSVRIRAITPCDENGELVAVDFNFFWFNTPISEAEGEETGGTVEPTAGSVYGITATSLAPRKFVIVGKSEKTGDEKFQYELNGLEYDETKFARIEQGIITASTPTTLEDSAVAWSGGLSSLGWYETLESGAVNKHLLVSWEPSLDRRVVLYDVYYKQPSDAVYTFAGSTAGASFDIGNIPTNVLDVRVDGVQQTGQGKAVAASKTQQLNFTQGNAAPANVSNFKHAVIGASVVLSWDAVADNDLEGYELRYTPAKSGTDWGLTPLLAFVPAGTTTYTSSYQDGTYFVKAKDYYGLYSEVARSRQTFAAPGVNINIVEAFDEAPLFVGAKTAVMVLSGQGLTIDDPQTNDTGYYEFDSEIDLGDVYVSRFTSTVNFSMGDIDSWVAYMGSIDAVPSMATQDSDTMQTVASVADLATVAAVGFVEYVEGMLELQLAISTDGAVFGSWEAFKTGDYEGRAFRFRLVLRTMGALSVPVVSQLAIQCDMPDRFESNNAVEVTEDATISIAFTTPFKAVPNVQITPLNLEANEEFSLSSVTQTGFDLTVNGHGHGSHFFNWLAQGYGKLVV